MRRSLVFAALAGALVLSSAASASEVRFRGAFTLTSVKNCIARYVGETFNSAFRPAGVGDNPNIASLTQLNQYSGDAYELPAGQNFTLNKWIRVEANGIDNLHYSFSARIVLTVLKPATFNKATNAVEIAGFIENMGNDPGTDGKLCTAGFRGAYFRRVE